MPVKDDEAPEVPIVPDEEQAPVDGEAVDEAPVDPEEVVAVPEGPEERDVEAPEEGQAPEEHARAAAGADDAVEQGVAVGEDPGAAVACT